MPSPQQEAPSSFLKAHFTRLSEMWRTETAMLSNLSQIVMHPAYQQIIAMGTVAIPLILHSLKTEPYHWFWALKILNGGVDVAEGATTLPDAAAAWIRWGRENGHLDSGK